MRIPIIAGNWKMNTTVDEAVSLVKAMLADLGTISEVETVLCPPFVSLVPVRELLQGTSVGLGAQNMFWEEKGAFTGEISPLMLAPLCQYVILGHSERRQYFGETDETVNRRVKAALKVGLTPIVCVGERLPENEAGLTGEVVTRQVRGAFAGIESLRGTVIAYEPVWAIGTGRPATGVQANATIAVIRGVLSDLYGRNVADGTRIQYGGSVTAANIAEFAGQPEVDGALVGGASLKPIEFVGIVERTGRAKHKM